MFNLNTILLLAALLCAFCDAPNTCMAVPAVSPDQGGPNAGGPSEMSPAKPTMTMDDVVQILERLAYNVEHNLTSVAECVTSGLIDVPREAMLTVLHDVQDFLSGFDPIFQTLLDTVKSFTNNLYSHLNLGADFGSGQILPSLFRVFRTIASAPLSSLLETFRAARNFAVGNAENAASEGFQIFLKFLTTTVLPWLHDFLARLQNSEMLPASLRTIIGDFNTAYNILVMLGYVSPSAS